LGRIEAVLLVCIIIFMVLISFTQVLLRNFTAAPFTWSDQLLRQLVLWIAGLGAGLAVLDEKHIKIDLLSYIGNAHVRKVAQLISNLFAAFICYLMTTYSIEFLQQRKLMAEIGVLGVPQWIYEIILPLAFGLLCWRFSLRAIYTILQKPGQ